MPWTMIRSIALLLIAAASLGAQPPARPRVTPTPATPRPPRTIERHAPVIALEATHPLLPGELAHSEVTVEFPHLTLLSETTPLPPLHEMPVTTTIHPTPAIAPAPPFELEFLRGPEIDWRAPQRWTSDAPPKGWAPDDPADSLYRRARELLNRGEYRLSANAFRDLSQRYPTSQYAPAALYWQAFALFRIGGTAELRQALGALETHRAKYPSARNEGDVTALNARVLGVLANRGDANAQRQLEQTAQPGRRCENDEDQAVRVEALRALYQNDPETVAPLIQQVLSRQDECSIQLRKNAVYIIGSRRDQSATPVLANVARNDPSLDVRVDAISFLGRLGDDAALGVLEELLRSSNEERIQRAAVRALSNHPNPRARERVRALVERNDAPERLRAEAIASFERDHVTADETGWLRTLYPRLTSTSLKQRAVGVVARAGGEENEAWLMALVRNEEEASEVRSTILSRLGQTMSIADLGKMYDGASSRMVREYIINVLVRRAEGEATDKLLDIAKNSTDPSLRRAAINGLTRKKDPRATRLLLEMISK